MSKEIIEESIMKTISPLLRQAGRGFVMITFDRPVKAGNVEMEIYSTEAKQVVQEIVSKVGPALDNPLGNYKLKC